MNVAFVSLVIPIYNEGSRIQPTLDKVVHYLTANFSRFEVIVVDDGSTDDTRQNIASIAGKDSRITSLSFPNNHGKGFAVRQGVLRASGDFIIFTDADLSTPVETIQHALQKALEGYPVVIASRRHPYSVIPVRQPWIREKVGVAFNVVVRALLRVPFRDTQCGFKAFSREAATKIFSLAGIDGFAFDVELLVIAQRLGYPVGEIPVRWSDAAGSKVKVMRGLAPVLKELWAIYRNDRQGLYSARGHPRR